MIVGQQPFVKIRYTEELDDTVGSDGRPLPSAPPTRTDERGTINPIPGSKLRLLPEGQRQGDQIRILTRVDMRTADDELGLIADHLEWEGREYVVISKQYYKRILPHYEYRALWTGSTA